MNANSLYSYISTLARSVSVRRRPPLGAVVAVAARVAGAARGRAASPPLRDGRHGRAWLARGAGGSCAINNIHFNIHIQKYIYI